MFEFDLQRFDEETAEQPTQSQPEPSTEEEKPIPEELSGLPEEIARETLAEWEKSQPKPEEESQEETPPEPKPPTEESVPYARFKEKVDEANQLKAQLAEYQRQAQQQQQPQQPPQPKPQFRPPQFQITPEDAVKINEAITAEAMLLSGMSQDDVASLEYADADDPRLAQWSQAKSIAQNNVYSAIRQERINRQQQARQFYDSHIAATQTYNEFVQKEFAEPDFKEIQNFAKNEFFEQLSPNEKQIVAGSYLRVEQQTASPAEMLNVVLFYKMAKAAYRTRDAKKAAPSQPKPQPQLPRADQLKGSSGTNDGRLSPHDIEKLLEGDFTKLDEKQRRFLLGYRN